MSFLPFGGRLRGVIRAAAALSLLACAGSKGDADSAVAGLPAYSPEAAQLFDDTFAPVLFGFDSEARVLAKDQKLSERTRLADFVLPARIETVSRVGGVEHRGAYEITLVPTAPPLVGAYAGGPLVVTIPTSNQSYAWLEGADVRWVGTPVIAFGRRYQREGRAELHFRCERDTAELRQIIGRDAGLRMLR